MPLTRKLLPVLEPHTCTNGIAIQRLVQTVQQAPTALPVTASSGKKGRHRWSLIVPPRLDVEYNAGKRQDPKAALVDDEKCQIKEDACLLTLHERFCSASFPSFVI